MTAIGWAQIAIYCAIIIAITPALGAYMTRVFNGDRTWLSPILRPVESAIYKIAGVDERHEQHAVTYTVGMLLFHVGGFLILYILMRVQQWLPFNPAGQTAVAPDLSFNTAISFITNTNWQNYGGESTLSNLVQMLGLTHQNYLSAATGIVLAMALIRGFARHSVRTVGNFWVDVTRCTLYLLDSALCAICAVPGLAGHHRRRSALMSTRPRWKAPNRPSQSGRSHRKSRSRCWDQRRRLLQCQWRASV